MSSSFSLVLGLGAPQFSPLKARLKVQSVIYYFFSTRNQCESKRKETGLRLMPSRTSSYRHYGIAPSVYLLVVFK